jgi:hypothetical protein
MRQIVYRVGRRAVLLLPVIALWMIFTGSAGATTSRPCTAEETAAGVTACFTGNVTATNVLQPVPGVNPTPCPPGTDPVTGMPTGDLVCEHYSVTLRAGQTATVCVGFPAGDMGLNDIDLFVVGPNGDVVASATFSNNPECVTFTNTTCVTQTFDVRINPAFVEDIGGFTITGTLTITNGTTACGTSGNGGGGTPGPGPTGASFTGGAKLADTGLLNVNVFETLVGTTSNKGKVKFMQKQIGCAFRSDTYSAVVSQTGVDAQGHTKGKADVTGNGYNNNQPVTFHLIADDNNEPGAGYDDFTITVKNSNGIVVCQDGGTIQDGNLQFHPTTS